MPLSTELSAALRRKISEASQGKLIGREMKALKELLELQQRWSSIPQHDELLIEKIKTRDGYQIFVFPFEGRLVHEGLAALLAYRISRFKTTTFTMACNDHGFVLQSPHDIDIESAIDQGVLKKEGLI
jgi:ATP-dependent Lhr-like helicase